MNHKTLHVAIIFLFLFPACTKKLSSVENKSQEQITDIYHIIQDVPYGEDPEQKMDIYLSSEGKSFGSRNFTIVFLHGGGYYLSDKRQEERYIEPYLKKGLNVVNLNYRLKRGIPLATSDLTNALNFLVENNSQYDLNLNNIIVTGFSAGAHIATNVGLSQNNPEYPEKLKGGIKITGIINFSGPVDQLDVVEKIFSDSDVEIMSEIGKALFTSEGYESKEVLAVYEPITWFDKNDPPIFIWHGGMDNQIPPRTFERFIPLMTNDKDVVMYIPEGQHSPNEKELNDAYIRIFRFLDEL